jgi:hypothetical protein
MRKSWADAARIIEVRQAARSWRDAGLIDATTLEAIDADYPDPRPRLAPAWRVLIFFLVTVAIHAVFVGLSMAHAGTAGSWVVFGIALAAVTEVLLASRFAGNGSDAATSFWAVVDLVIGIGILLTEGASRNFDEAITLVLIAAVILFAAACVHWGFAIYGTFATAAFFLTLGRFPFGRAASFLAGVILIGISRRNLDRPYPPPLRRAVSGVFAVSAVALYVAINRYSIDARWIERLQAHSSLVAASDAVRALSAIATALVSLIFPVWGVRSRRNLILDLGLAFAAASLVTLRYYVHIAPLWAVLTLAGTALVLIALRLDRVLRRAPGGEIGGFTSAPLSSVKGAEAIQAAAVIAGMTSSPPAARSGELSPGGGGFGGGGASSEF